MEFADSFLVAWYVLFCIIFNVHLEKCVFSMLYIKVSIDPLVSDGGMLKSVIQVPLVSFGFLSFEGLLAVHTFVMTAF